MSTPEEIKAASDHLRGTLAEDLASSDDGFVADNQVLLKFHGIYQQDDRDVRRARASKKLPLDYSCMVRTAVPGGVVSAEQWLALDRLADVADGSMRLTTRQGVQFHVVHKRDLRALVAAINATDLTTIAACGDVVRNTMACPMPDPDGRQAVLRPAVQRIAAHFRPHTTSYWELWVDGERAVTAEPIRTDGVVEPIYGSTYLPRKFKIGLAWPGDNCVDVYTQDIGLVPVDGGWQVVVGGGLGMSHARPDDTYPLLASELAWVPDDALLAVTEAIVTTQRDHGDRSDRHRARLKYLVEARGIEWMRAQVAERSGVDLAAPVALAPWTDADLHHGWSENDEGAWCLGVPIASGRVRDRTRDALRELASSGLVPELRVTARQDVLLNDVDGGRRSDVEEVLRNHGVAHDGESALRRIAIACPALPTCGQALSEAERVLPALVDGIDAVSGATELRLNMTGCPNGCARPYTAEVGIVGRGKTTYDIYLGGAVGGDRLAESVRADVPLADIPATLAPVFERYRAESLAGEGFGDFCHRIGVATVATWLPPPSAKRRREAVAT
jgi:sulfite reductase (ferredoxin)